MQIIKPQALTLMSSNVPEENYPVWSETSTYNTGDIVLVEELGVNKITKKYKSLQDGNTNHYPPDNPDWWQDLGATNKWKMFDEYVTTQTENSDSIDVRVRATKAYVICLLEIEAVDGTIEVYAVNEDDTTGDLLTTYELSFIVKDSQSWSDYFFSPIEYSSHTAIYENYYNYEKLEYHITLNKSGGTAKCGSVICGYPYQLGLTTFGANVSILDYSIKTVDNYGRAYLQQGNYSKEVEFDVEVFTNRLAFVRNTLASFRATPMLWWIDNETNEFDCLLLYGFYRNFEIVLPNPLVSKCTITVEGLI